MHVLISVLAAILVQTPGVHLGAVDAAMSVERAAAPRALSAGAGRDCPCRLPHRAH